MKSEYRQNNVDWEQEEFEDSFEQLQQQHQNLKAQNRLRRQHEARKRQQVKTIVDQGQVRFGVTGWTAKGGTLTYQSGTAQLMQRVGNHVHYKCYGRGNASKYWKKQCSKKSRQNLDLPNGNAYRKELDYWWELF